MLPVIVASCHQYSYTRFLNYQRWPFFIFILFYFYFLVSASFLHTFLLPCVGNTKQKEIYSCIDDLRCGWRRTLPGCERLFSLERLRQGSRRRFSCIFSSS